MVKSSTTATVDPERSEFTANELISLIMSNMQRRTYF